MPYTGTYAALTSTLPEQRRERLDLWCAKSPPGDAPSVRCGEFPQQSPDLATLVPIEERSGSGILWAYSDRSTFEINFYDLDLVTARAGAHPSTHFAIPAASDFQCVQRVNQSYLRGIPLPLTAAQQAIATTLLNKCRADILYVPVPASAASGSAAVLPKPAASEPQSENPNSPVSADTLSELQATAERMAERCGENSFQRWLDASQHNGMTPPSSTLSDTKYRESFQNCKAALGLVNVAESVLPPTPVPTQATPVPLWPKVPTTALTSASEIADRANREVVAIQCERAESQRLTDFWRQHQDPAARAAKLRDLQLYCRAAQHLPDIDHNQPSTP